MQKHRVIKIAIVNSHNRTSVGHFLQLAGILCVSVNKQNHQTSIFIHSHWINTFFAFARFLRALAQHELEDNVNTRREYIVRTNATSDSMIIIFYFSFLVFLFIVSMEIVFFGCALTHATVRLKFYCPTEWKNGESWTLRWMRKYSSHSAVHVNVGTYFECNRKSNTNTSDQFSLCNRKRRLYCSRDIFDWIRPSCRTLAYKHTQTLTHTDSCNGSCAVPFHNNPITPFPMFTRMSNTMPSPLLSVCVAHISSFLHTGRSNWKGKKTTCSFAPILLNAFELATRGRCMNRAVNY